MRTQLQPLLGRKYPGSARVADFGLRHAIYCGAVPTMCLTNVRLQTENGEISIGHVWVFVGKKIAKFNPARGDQIEFYCWVREYFRCSVKSCEKKNDYAIGQLSKLQKISSGEGESFAVFWARLARSGKFVTDRIQVPCLA